MATNTVQWSREKLARFKSAYAEALHTDTQVFDFEGNQFALGYAKYLIEYLEDRFDTSTKLQEQEAREESR